MKKVGIQNYGITILIFGTMVGIGYFMWKAHKEGIEKDIEQNWN